jgi:hypothetical protein
MLCKYSNLFGPPGQGIHSYRAYNIAYLDILVTIVASLAISYAFNIPLFYTILAMFVLGVIVHRVFCVRTTVDKFLFP